MHSFIAFDRRDASKYFDNFKTRTGISSHPHVFSEPPDQKLSLGEVSMGAGQHRKYLRKYEAQAWKYLRSGGRKVTFSGLGPAMAGEDVLFVPHFWPILGNQLKTDIVPAVAILR